MLSSNRAWGSTDRKFLAETVYEIVRWWRKLWFLAGEEPSANKEKIGKIIGIYLALKEYELPPWKEFEELNKKDFKSRFPLVDSDRRIAESIPDWLDETGIAELGDCWEKELHELNKQASLIIRVNTLKITSGLLKEKLRNEGIETAALQGYPDALKINSRSNVIGSACYKMGYFEVQDASSQCVAYFMDLKQGMTVIDACAGGGGKSLHIASIMKNRGKIIALDIHDRKLEELRKRAKRAEASIIETRVIIDANEIERLKETADRLLLDVPCSGLGIMRRNPDIKWKLSLQAVQEIRENQFQIISSYSTMVKPGGRVIYATCSILPSENEKIVQRFLRNNKNFILADEKKLLPSQTGYDGFYMAAIERSFLP